MSQNKETYAAFQLRVLTEQVGEIYTKLKQNDLKEADRNLLMKQIARLSKEKSIWLSKRNHEIYILKIA